MPKPSVYVAGPLGFSEVGRFFYNGIILKDLRRMGFEVLDPWGVPEVNRGFEEAAARPFGPAQQAALTQASRFAGQRNEAAIRRADLVLAILDGPDVDSGTASEVGFAAGLNKPIIGYRGDFRLAADNIGSAVNLQVEHFIFTRGGTIFTSWDQVRDSLKARYIGYAATPIRRA